MEREREERERNRTATYLWSSSASAPSGGTPSTISKRRGGPGSPAYTQSSAYRHSLASKHAWRPPELQHNFTSGQTGAAKHLNHPGSTRPSSDVSAACEPSLLDGMYDEDKARRDFQEALQAWRGPAAAAACSVTTSTTVSTGSTNSQLPEKELGGCTLFHRLAIGYLSQAASLQAAQNCVCEPVGGNAVDQASHALETVQAVKTEPESSKSAADLPSSLLVHHTVQLPKDSAPVHVKDAEEDEHPDNVLSISNFQLSQALTSRIRLPDAVHVPVTAFCGRDTAAE